MKKLISLFFVVFLCSLFFAFNSNSVLYLPKNNKMLIGKWQLISIYNNKSNIEFKDFSNCKKRDYIEYEDSTRIDNIYNTFKSGCSKVVTSYKYKILNMKDYNEDHTYPTIKIESKPNRVLERIIILNDSILKVDCEYHRLFKTYRKLK